jgi:hypothetical protein
MSKTDTVYVRELLELTGARDLYEDLGVEPGCSRVELVAALERKREWARRFPDDPVARWWTRHMVRTARILVHDEAPSPHKRKRQDDLQAAIKGAVLQGTLGPEMRRLVTRMGERRGLDGAQVDAMIDQERQSLEDLQKKARAALGKSPGDEAKEAIRAAMWGAMVAGNVSPSVIAKIVDRGCALGLDVETVRKVLDEVKAEWKEEREESLDTDLQGRWVPPHRRVQREDAPRRAPAESDGKWALSDSLEDGLDDVVRNARDERDDLPELDLDPSAGFGLEDPISQDASSALRRAPVDDEEDRNAVTGASHVLSVRAIPAPSAPPPVIAQKESSLPAAVRHVAEPPSSTTLSLPTEETEEEAKAKAKAKALALHTALSTVAVFGGAFYGVTWFLLAHRSHLF